MSARRISTGILLGALLVLSVFGGVTRAPAVEEVALTTPITTPSITSWRVSSLHLDWDNSQITIRLKGPNGEAKFHSYGGATALTMMVALNKANLTTNSLHKRVLNQLITDGVILGTVTGAPD